MRKFVEKSSICHQQVVIVLLSSDINFEPLLSEFKLRYKTKIILIHNTHVNDKLIQTADEHYPFSDFAHDLPQRKKSPQKEHAIIVKNLPLNSQSNPSIKLNLKRLFDNTGGKIVKVTDTQAIISFSTETYASRALKKEVVSKLAITSFRPRCLVQ